MEIYWNILTMHGPINVKSPNNVSEWQMGFNSAFKGLIHASNQDSLSFQVKRFFQEIYSCVYDYDLWNKFNLRFILSW